MQTTCNEIGINDLRRFVGILGTDNLSDDFFITEIDGKDEEQVKKTEIVSHPCRFDGILIIYCASGNIDVEVNLKSYKLDEKTALINVPGNIFRVKNIKDIHDSKFVIIALSSEFIMSSIKIDFATMFNDSLSMLDSPCLKLNDEDFDVCVQYYMLLHTMMDAKSPQLKNATKSLLSSIIYFLGARWADTIKNAKKDDSNPQSLRSKMIFDKFINLVNTYHTSERSMGFYADMMALTPKYLSKLIKNVSGKSGPEWIDQYVILEAKNLLKYSTKSIKEVMYALNFQNQSVFYKFFKAHTGMTPSEYRES